jgi:hypothetical protein
MTHFDNHPEREIFDAIQLLKDENLVWSADFESIRKNLGFMLERIMQVEWRYLEPEIGDLCLNLIRDKERETNVRESTTTRQAIPLQDKRAIEQAGEKGSGCSGVCSCKPRVD